AGAREARGDRRAALGGAGGGLFGAVRPARFAHLRRVGPRALGGARRAPGDPREGMSSIVRRGVGGLGVELARVLAGARGVGGLAHAVIEARGLLLVAGDAVAANIQIRKIVACLPLAGVAGALVEGGGAVA